MPVKKILLINAADSIGGDVAMWLMGLPYLSADRFQLYAISIPRGSVYQTLCSLSNATVIPMELGGKEGRSRKHPKHIDILLRSTETVMAISRIAALVIREKIDLIFALDRTISLPISFCVSRITGCSLVLNAHISHYLETSRLHRTIVKHATAVTVTSEDMYQRFLPFVKTSDCIYKLPNAIHIEKYDLSISGAQVRAEFGLPAEAQVVVLAGRLSPFKGQDDLIRAVPIILQERPNTFFLLAGAENVPGFAMHLKTLIEQYNVNNHVKLIGYRNDIPVVMASADVCTMPSHAEPFGLVALEAMAMGKPVVATRAGGVPEFIIDGETGILIPPRDPESLARALIDLLCDPERASRIGQRARQHINDFFTDKVYGLRFSQLLWNL